MKLVDVAAAKEYANTVLNDPFLKMAVNSVLDHAPGIELVQCKDCKNWKEPWLKDQTYGRCMIGKTSITDPDHFCSNGERKASE